MKVYEIITNIILKKLEEGVIPWQIPWNTKQAIPRNLITKKPYQGINIFILACQRYSSPYWLTFNQCKDLGGTIRKGETGIPIVYWNWPEIEEAEDTEKKAPFLRYYTAFNIAQCENLPENKMPNTPGTEDNHLDRIDHCEKIMDRWSDKPEIRHGKQRAAYIPASVLIIMPPFANFKKSEEYYSTLFHECIHGTGHQKRLNRQGITDTAPFGTPCYSKEELIAEMGSAFLCGFAGIEQATIDNSAAYILGWLEKLKNDRKLVTIAAGQAHKAANYILNISTS